MSRSQLWLLSGLLLTACGSSSNDSGGLIAVTTTSTTTTTSSATPTTTTTTTTALTGQVFDCATVSPVPLSVTEMPQAYGFHDVDFDQNGYILGATQSNVAMGKTTYAGDFQVFAPGTGAIQQMVWLPDGDLAVASDTRGILRINAQGSSTVINGNLRPYGLILGSDDLLYAAVEFNGVFRVDPVSGQAQEIIPNLPNGSPRVINFNLDDTKMYIGTRGGNGKIFQVDLDENLDPISAVTTLATGIGAGEYHDTLAVDLCGYLYVTDYTTKNMWRIAPDGTNYVYMEGGSGLIFNNHIHGIEWGNGIGGWRTDAIYVTKPYQQNTVSEVVIGVPSKDWTEGYAINLP